MKDMGPFPGWVFVCAECGFRHSFFNEDGRGMGLTQAQRLARAVGWSSRAGVGWLCQKHARRRAPSTVAREPGVPKE
jgi:anti-sigma regulatory factor (Ser/Thr protein kinase)